MRVSSRLSVSPAITVALSAVVVVVVVVVAIAIIFLAANVTITNAQQLTSQPAVTQNGTRLFQNTEDSIRVQVPEGWVIHDVNNTGSVLSDEARLGYGILAQLCPQEEEEQQQRGAAALSNVSGSGSNTVSCQGSEGGDIIHIVRYPDLNTTIQATNNVTTTTTNNNNNNNTTSIDNNVLSYHLQKLQEVGYSGIEIVNSTDTTLNVVNAQTNQTIAIVPAKSAEITYSTNSAPPNETRTGYFILAATNATAPNLGTTTKGYSMFYEGNSTTTSTAAETTTTTIPFGSLALATPLSAPVRQVFDSFELVTVAAPAPPTIPPPSRPLPPPAP